MTRVCMVVTNDVTFDSRVRKEAETLSEAGYAVTVIGLSSTTQTTTERQGSITIRRIVPDVISPRSLGQIVRYFRPLLHVGTAVHAALYRALIEEPADVYHAHDLDTLLPAYRAAYKRHAKLVYDSHELFVDTIDEFATNDPFVRRLVLKAAKLYYRFVEQHCITRADAVVCVSKSMAQVLQNRCGLRTTPTVVRNTPPANPFIESNELRRTLRLESGQIIVLNQGVIGPGRGFEQLVGSLSHLPEQFHLVIVGNGTLRHHLERLAADRGLTPRIHFIPRIPPERLPTLTASADIGTVLLENLSLNEQVALPNKLFEYAMAGLTVVATDQPEIRAHVERYGLGVTFAPLTAANLADAIIRVSLRAGDRHRRQYIADVAKQSLSWQNERRMLLHTYQRLIQ